MAKIINIKDIEPAIKAAITEPATLDRLSTDERLAAVRWGLIEYVPLKRRYRVTAAGRRHVQLFG